jgi:hypothetical protein
MNIQIRPTTIETRQEFASLLDEANTWQKARGSQGWTGAFDDDWMLPRIDRGELYLVYMDGEPVSAFRILYEDRAFWGEREVGDSIYLHTFAVRRSKAGLGIGNAARRAGWSRRRNPPSWRFITADHDPPYGLNQVHGPTMYRTAHHGVANALELLPLSGHSAHRWTCCRLDFVVNDPKPTPCCSDPFDRDR